MNFWPFGSWISLSRSWFPWFPAPVMSSSVPLPQVMPGTCWPLSFLVPLIGSAHFMVPVIVCGHFCPVDGWRHLDVFRRGPDTGYGSGHLDAFMISGTWMQVIGSGST
jgi:hypothetical protein